VWSGNGEKRSEVRVRLGGEVDHGVRCKQLRPICRSRAGRVFKGWSDGCVQRLVTA
jgi:hypothetical protein